MNDFHMTQLNKNAKIHFIGIGGISMSGLAHISLIRGYTVTGSDSGTSPILDRLSAAGATVYHGHAAENCTGADLVVYTAAIKDDNPELMYAREHGITEIDQWEEDYKRQAQIDAWEEAERRRSRPPKHYRSHSAHRVLPRTESAW